MTELSQQGQEILRELVSFLEENQVVPGDPKTYTHYGTVHTALRLPMRGKTVGDSLKVQGLKNLADWCHDHGHPAITGLIVDTGSLSPGGGYYDAFGVPANSYQWWEVEIRKSVDYDWSKFLPKTTNDKADEPTPAASDVDEPPKRVRFSAYRILRDTEIARNVKRMHNHECQICGTTIVLPDGSRYAEAHHIRPLGRDGPDTTGNVMCVCPNHHAELDYGVRSIDLGCLRKHPSHAIDRRHVEFHNLEIYQAAGGDSAQAAP